MEREYDYCKEGFDPFGDSEIDPDDGKWDGYDPRDGTWPEDRKDDEDEDDDDYDD